MSLVTLQLPFDADAHLRFDDDGGAIVRAPVARPAPSSATTRRRRAERRPTSTEPQLQRAQVVWQRALQLSGPRSVRDGVDTALELFRAAHHDPATMTHALGLGNTALRRNAGDLRARAAADLLEAAIHFLGVKPRKGDARSGSTC